MVIKPRVRGFMCITSHPAGCEANVQSQIDYVTQRGALDGGPEKVLVIGASTGYGLASRITAAFASNADTLGLFFEKEGTEKKPATGNNAPSTFPSKKVRSGWKPSDPIIQHWQYL